MNLDKMTLPIETARLVLFPFTQESLSLFNQDLPAFEQRFGVVYQGEELDHLLRSFLLKLEKELAENPEHFLFFTEFLIACRRTGTSGERRRWKL